MGRKSRDKSNIPADTGDKSRNGHYSKRGRNGHGAEKKEKEKRLSCEQSINYRVIAMYLICMLQVKYY